MPSNYDLDESEQGDELETDTEATEASGDELVEEEASEPEILGVPVSLDELAARPGSTGDLARELLALKAERIAKAEAEGKAAQALAVSEAATWNSIPEDDLRAMFAARQEQARVADDASFRREFEAALRAEGWGEDTVQQKLQLHDAEVKASAWLVGDADPLLQEPAYQAHLREKALQRRSMEFVEESWLQGRTILDDATDASVEIERELAMARLRG